MVPPPATDSEGSVVEPSPPAPSDSSPPVSTTASVSGVTPRNLNFDDLLDCPVCLELLVEPVTLTCGHTFCRPCLVESISRSNKQCPSCRALCHVDPVSHPESNLLKEFILRMAPERYQERLETVAEARTAWSQRHPIFFYPDVTFPTAPVAFHIIDPRYRLLMERVASGSRIFVWVPTARPFVVRRGDLGILCKLSDLQHLADGRYLITATAEHRISVTDTWQEPGVADLHYASVQPYTDTPLDLSAQVEITEPLRAQYEALREVVDAVPRMQLVGLPELPDVGSLTSAAEIERVTWRCCAALFSLLSLGRERLPMGGGLLGSRDPRTRLRWITGCVEQLQAYLATQAAVAAENAAARHARRQARRQRGSRPTVGA